jgi:hypothetical protein
MIITRIVERFTMEVSAPKADDPWFLDWVLRSPREAGHHLTAGWLALNSLKPHVSIETAREYFGGMGAQALMVQEVFRPSYHSVSDFSEDAVNHMNRVLPRHVAVSQADAYHSARRQADLVMLDFGDLTAWKTREDLPHRKLLDDVFAMEPKAVVFTDIACRYLHLHRERYETLLGTGTCGSYEAYLEALLSRFEALYGYRLVDGYWDRWSAVMALVPDGVVRRGTLHQTPATPVGLELF